MGIRLIVEILDHAPANLTPGDRLLLIAIAENVRDSTRTGYPGWELLVHRMGWADQYDGGRNALSQALARLAERGVDVRVPIGKIGEGLKGAGRPVYAAHGHRTTYRIPRLAPPGDSSVVQTPTLMGGSETHPSTAEQDDEGWYRDPLKGGTETHRRVGASTTPSPHPSANPQEKQQRPSAHSRARAQQPQPKKPPAYVARIVKATGASLDEARAVARLIAERRSPTNLGGLINVITRAGELGIWLDEVRATAQEGHHAANASMPACEHGYPGGHVTEPLTGWAPCPVHRWAGVTPDRAGELHADLERMRADDTLPAEVESVIYAAFSNELLDALTVFENAAKEAA